MKRPILALLAFLQFMLISCPARADISVSMRLDREEATIADSISMVVSIAGARESDSHQWPGQFRDRLYIFFTAKKDRDF
jgi:hypothetical protein